MLLAKLKILNYLKYSSNENLRYYYYYTIIVVIIIIFYIFTVIKITKKIVIHLEYVHII